MAARYDSYRRRPARSRRGEPEVDAIAVALTVQVIVCILLLLAALVAKKVSEDSYADFKQEFIGLVGSDARGEQMAEYFAELGSMGKGFFASVESLLQKAFGGGEPDQPRSGDPAEEEDQIPPEQVADDEGHLTAADLGYSYLEAQGVATGQIPQQWSQGPGMMEAPAGASLAPVYLSARIKPPVTGRVTSNFAYREHPITGNTDFHNGVDIAAQEGRGILAALAGEVEEIGWSDIYGNYVILRHASNLKTFYAHCSQVVAQEGMAVRQGERIAKVGSTGMVTGPHLHFSVLVDDLYTDPYWVLSDYLEPLI